MLEDADWLRDTLSLGVPEDEPDVAWLAVADGLTLCEGDIDDE